MLDEQIRLSKAPLVQQKVKPFARSQPALGVLSVNALRPAAEIGPFAEVS
jgi:hypothetical protein